MRRNKILTALEDVLYSYDLGVSRDNSMNRDCHATALVYYADGGQTSSANLHATLNWLADMFTNPIENMRWYTDDLLKHYIVDVRISELSYKVLR